MVTFHAWCRTPPATLPLTPCLLTLHVWFQVYIVGQSAGADSVSQHLVRPKSWGLFSSAGMESGAFYDGVQTATVAGQKPGWDKVVTSSGALRLRTRPRALPLHRRKRLSRPTCTRASSRGQSPLTVLTSWRLGPFSCRKARLQRSPSSQGRSVYRHLLPPFIVQ